MPPSITTEPITVAKRTKQIREEWVNKLHGIKDTIRELERSFKANREKLDKDPELLNLRHDRGVHELEVEAWSVALAQQDAAWLSEHLTEIKKKIAASKDGSARSDTASTHS